MENKRYIKKFNETVLNTDFSEIMDNIINELKHEHENYENPSTYMDNEYYVRCRAKAEAFEDAIRIVEKHYNKNKV
jgi:hypothetical protein